MKKRLPVLARITNPIVSSGCPLNLADPDGTGGDTLKSAKPISPLGKGMKK
jgi:hypothetical protein